MNQDELYIVYQKYLKLNQSELSNLPPIDPVKKLSIPTILLYFIWNQNDTLSFLMTAVEDCILIEISKLIKLQHDPSSRFIYPWDTLNYVVNSILNHTSEAQVTQRIFNMFDQLGLRLENAKKQEKLDHKELEELVELSVQLSDATQIKSIFTDGFPQHTSNWNERFRLDALQVQERALVCKGIKDKVFEKIAELTKGLAHKECRMADIKGMPRALVKLQEYLDEKRSAHLPVTSATYDCKDLLRLSFVCESAADTTAIFNALTSENPFFTVFSVKNGFTKYVPGKYCDIKVILKTKYELCRDFEELVEVQIIQSLFIDFKKIEHKIYDFIRSKEEYSKRLEVNVQSDIILSQLLEADVDSHNAKELAIESIKNEYYELPEVKKYVDIAIDVTKFEGKDFYELYSYFEIPQMKKYILEIIPNILINKMGNLSLEEILIEIKEMPELLGIIINTDSKIITNHIENLTIAEIKYICKDISELYDFIFKIDKKTIMKVITKLSPEEIKEIRTIHEDIPELTGMLQNDYTVAGGNGKGSESNQLNQPAYFYLIEKTKNILVADKHNHRIQYIRNGDIENSITIGGGNGQGSDNDQLNFPTSVCLDPENSVIYVCDSGNNRIVKIQYGDIYGTTVCGGFNYGGSRSDELNSPSYCHVDGVNIYVADTDNHRIQHFYLGETEATTVCGGNGKGSGKNQLSHPSYFYLDPETQDMFVCDTNNHRIQKFEYGSKYGETYYGGKGCGSNYDQLNYPTSIHYDSEYHHIYVVDSGNKRIQLFEYGINKGHTVYKTDKPFEPIDVYIDSKTKEIYVSDKLNNKISMIINMLV